MYSYNLTKEQNDQLERLIDTSQLSQSMKAIAYMAWRQGYNDAMSEMYIVKEAISKTLDTAKPVTQVNKADPYKY